MTENKPLWCSARTKGITGRNTSLCSNRARVLRDGKWYCKIHDPVRVAEREERRRLAEQDKARLVASLREDTFLSKMRKHQEYVSMKRALQKCERLLTAVSERVSVTPTYVCSVLQDTRAALAQQDQKGGSHD